MAMYITNQSSFRFVFSIGSPNQAQNQLPFAQFSFSPIIFLLAPLHIFELYLIVALLIGSTEYIMQAMYVLVYEKAINQQGNEIYERAFKQ